MARSARDELLESLDRILKGLEPIVDEHMSIQRTCEDFDVSTEVHLSSGERELLEKVRPSGNSEGFVSLSEDESRRIASVCGGLEVKRVAA